MVKWARKKDGKEIAIVEGYTFYCHYKNRIRERWSCTHGKTCKAFLSMTNSEMVTRRIIRSRQRLDHNHTRPRFVIHNVTWATKKNGKDVAVINGYTFYHRIKHQMTSTWNCTFGRACRARMIVTNGARYQDRHLVSSMLKHTHPPPAFIICDGMYIKTAEVKPESGPLGPN
ncbi:hypothetical protein B5X24_HaOG203948 [Helicoverpa armigera]|uniref:FLYWCH-type domain-containing protein n=1 Tax=Helicoverpa armigera TaxID=29058 RepID=A0A2W1BUX6_HELAM|nr:hypothetical protein B5X24_HaOG203948 [Helicoverpa armigera]